MWIVQCKHENSLHSRIAFPRYVNFACVYMRNKCGLYNVNMRIPYTVGLLFLGM